ncbi:UDP-N-acetylglucosamine acyltransferase [Achromatium sp. WMS2]|nr:UDP-N-acetylglucosamine acyltransferase [Achromatium sp. WMS2]
MIDARAVVDSKAKLDENVKVGPFAIIGPHVEIGRDSSVGAHTFIKGPTRIGKNNKIFQFASIGDDPQDRKYGGERTQLDIGDNNTIREFVTINRGTMQGGGTTRIGNDGLFMAYVHIAHDCQVGNNVIMANAASLGGHVTIEDWAILGGFAIVHQFCKIGKHSFSAMGSVLTKDVPPFITVAGHPAEARGINIEGLKRRAFTPETIQCIKRAYRLLYLSGMRLEEALDLMEDMKRECPEVRFMADFIIASTRSITR